jgi:hypothetical protein
MQKVSAYLARLKSKLITLAQKEIKLSHQLTLYDKDSEEYEEIHARLFLLNEEKEHTKMLIALEIGCE